MSAWQYRVTTKYSYYIRAYIYEHINQFTACGMERNIVSLLCNDIPVSIILRYCMLHMFNTKRFLESVYLGYLCHSSQWEIAQPGYHKMAATFPATLSKAFLWLKRYIPAKVLLNFVVYCPTDDKTALTQIMVWRQTCDMSLSEIIMAYFTDTHMCHSTSLSL